MFVVKIKEPNASTCFVSTNRLEGGEGKNDRNRASSPRSEENSISKVSICKFSHLFSYRRIIARESRYFVDLFPYDGKAPRIVKGNRCIPEESSFSVNEYGK